MTKKEKVLYTMLRLIAQNGYSGTPMSMVIKKSGVAAGTIYHHFKSKEDILEELYSLLKQRMGHALNQDINPTSSYKENFKKYWTNLYTYFINYPDEFRFLEYCGNSPYITEKVKEKNKVYYLPVIQFLNEGIEKEIIKKIDLELLVAMLYGSVVSVTNLKLNGYKNFNQKIIEAAVEACWKGIVN